MTTKIPFLLKQAEAEGTLLKKSENPFSEEIPTLQLFWDSTSLTKLKTCPRLYQLEILEGWRPKAANAALTFGVLYHAALEVWDKALASGDDFRTASRKTLRYALEQTGEYKQVLRCLDCKKIAEEDAEHCGYCGCENIYPSSEFFPWESNDTKRNRYCLIRAIVWYIDLWAGQDHFDAMTFPNGKPAVELSFRYELGYYSENKESFYYCGHFDKISKSEDSTFYVVDRKSTGGTLNTKFFEGFSPDNQITGYVFAAKVVFEIPVVGAMIDGVELAVEFNRFQRGFANRTQACLDEWYKDLEIWLKLAENFARANYWPQNDTACDKYGGCRFREVCSKSPSVREAYLRADFTRKPWNPLETR